MGENHIFLGPNFGIPPYLRDKNPFKTIEKGAFLPIPSSPGSYSCLSCNKDFARLHMGVPRLGSESELQLLAYTTARGIAGSLTHGVKPEIEPASSWIPVGFVTAEP